MDVTNQMIQWVLSICNIFADDRKTIEYIVMLAIVLLNCVTLSDMLRTEIRNSEIFDNLIQSYP